VQHNYVSVVMKLSTKAGHREVEVTRRRTKPNFVAFVQYLAQKVYTQAPKIHLVLRTLLASYFWPNWHRGVLGRLTGLESYFVAK